MTDLKLTPKAVLFDLDGTLLDSAKDLHSCLNKILDAYSCSNIDLDLVQQNLNAGAKGLIALAFQEKSAPKNLETLRQELLTCYTDMSLHSRAHFFEGTLSLLHSLSKNHIPWGIVTNKHERFTRPILQNLDLLDKTGAIICGDMVTRGKPSPIPLLMACNQLNIKPEEAIYIGDSLADMQAAQNALMPGFLVLWGYWQRLRYSTEDWPCTRKLEKPEELSTILSL